MPITNITGNLKLDEELVAKLQNQLGIYHNYAIGYHEGELGVRVRQAWEYYYGKLPEPVSNGSSSWVDRSVWEAVNGTLQELISVFCSSEQAVKFAPEHSQDGFAAQAATDMVNQILLRDNDGYNALSDAFKECLVSRVSFVKRYWAKEKQYREETFEDLTPEEYDLYLLTLDGEPEEIDITTDDKSKLISGKIKYFKVYEGPRIEYVPFEQMMIEPTATTLRNSNYVAHRVRKSKDELKQMGFDKDLIESLNPASSDVEAGVIANARINNLSPLNVSDVLSVGDDGADKLWLHEHYMKSTLANKDGEVEILQIFTVHQKVLEVNRVSEYPFELFTPFPTPGTVWGESVYDITKDIQDLNTALVRGIIDNIMNANFRRYMAVKGAYDRQSLLNNRPGGVVEVQSQDAVRPFEYHQLPNGIFDLLEYTEGKKEARTGVTRVGQGLDPNVFKNDNSTATVGMVMSAAQNRLRMVARNIAERGMKELMLGIYELVRVNGSKPIRVKLAQGEAVIDPRMLPPRREMITAVAIGASEKRERAAALQNTLMMLTQIPAMSDFLQPTNAYRMAEEILICNGIYDVESFITPLENIPPKQPDPTQQMQMQMLMEQVKHQQAQTQQLISTIQNDRERLVFEQQKAADEIHAKVSMSNSSQDKMADEMAMSQAKIQLEHDRLDLQRQQLELKRQEIMIEAQLENKQHRAVGLGQS